MTHLTFPVNYDANVIQDTLALSMVERSYVAAKLIESLESKEPAGACASS
jgi:hypothetical protein